MFLLLANLVTGAVGAIWDVRDICIYISNIYSSLGEFETYFSGLVAMCCRSGASAAAEWETTTLMEMSATPLM